jgi:hypothetical protein
MPRCRIPILIAAGFLSRLPRYSLATLLANAPSPLHYSDHQLGHGRAFHEKACAMSLEGIVSKRAASRSCAGHACGYWLPSRRMTALGRTATGQ